MILTSTSSFPSNTVKPSSPRLSLRPWSKSPERLKFATTLSSIRSVPTGTTSTFFALSTPSTPGRPSWDCSRASRPRNSSNGFLISRKNFGAVNSGLMVSISPPSVPAATGPRSHGTLPTKERRRGTSVSSRSGRKAHAFPYSYLVPSGAG